MERRGQITIFIVILIISVILIILIFFLKADSNKEGSFDEGIINSFVHSCLEDSVIKSLSFFGLQGIDYNNSEDFGNLSFVSIPYFYFLGENQFPSIKETEEILGIYIDSYFDECIRGFRYYREQGYSIDSEKKKISVNVGPKMVRAKLNYPLSVSKGNYSYILEEFRSDIDFGFKDVHDVIVDFIREQGKNPDYVPAGYIGRISIEKNITIKMLDFPLNTVIFVFELNEIKLSNIPYTFLFGVKYDWSGLDSLDSELEINNLSAVVGEDFTYKIYPQEDYVRFIDYSPLFDIDFNTGEINFRPEVNNIGNYSILIKAFNINDKSEEEFLILHLEVKENE